MYKSDHLKRNMMQQQQEEQKTHKIHIPTSTLQGVVFEP